MRKILILLVIVFSLSLFMLSCSLSCSNEEEEKFIDIGEENFEKEAVILETPKIMIDEDNNIFWKEIEKATGYVVNVNGNDFSIQSENKFSLIKEAGNYSIKVMAKGNGKEYLDSKFSDLIQYISEGYFDISKSEGLSYLILGKDYIKKGGNYQFTLSLSYLYEGSVDVYVNGNEIFPNDGIYIVPNVSNNLVINVDESRMELKSSKVTFTNNTKHVTVNGGDKVTLGEDFEFEVETNSNYAEIVYFDNKLIRKHDSGKYVVENVMNDINIIIEEYSKDNNNTFIGETSTSTFMYYDTCYNTTKGDLDGLGFCGNSGSKFFYPFERKLTTGLNRIIEFSTRNSYGGDEVKSVQFDITDTSTNNCLSVNFLSFKSQGGESPNALITLYYNGDYVCDGDDGYKFNFSNLAMEEPYCQELPYIDLDNELGKLICGKEIYQGSELIGFGINGTTISITLQNVEDNRRGIIVRKLFNESIDLTKLISNEFYGQASFIENYTQNCESVSITGTKVAGSTGTIARYYSDTALNNGENMLLEFLTTNNNDNKIYRWEIYFNDGNNEVMVDLATGWAVTGLSDYKGAFVYGMYLNGVSLGVQELDYNTNTQNSGVIDGSYYFKKPNITIDTTTGRIAYDSIGVSSEVLKGFGSNGVSIKIVYTASSDNDAGLVIGTIFNKKI